MTESVLITATVEAKEQRDIATFVAESTIDGSYFRLYQSKIVS